MTLQRLIGVEQPSTVPLFSIAIIRRLCVIFTLFQLVRFFLDVYASNHVHALHDAAGNIFIILLVQLILLITLVEVICYLDHRSGKAVRTTRWTSYLDKCFVNLVDNH